MVGWVQGRIKWGLYIYKSANDNVSVSWHWPILIYLMSSNLNAPLLACLSVSVSSAANCRLVKRKRKNLSLWGRCQCQDDGPFSFIFLNTSKAKLYYFIPSNCTTVWIMKVMLSFLFDKIILSIKKIKSFKKKKNS